MGFYGTVAALGSAGPLASRAFLPLLAVLLLARFPAVLQYLGAPPVRVPEALSFLTSSWCLVLVAVLALLELLADKNHDVKEAYDLTMVHVKAAVAVLVVLAVVPGEATRLVPGARQAGLSGALALGFGVGLGTWQLARLRRRFFDSLRALDDDDALGVQKLISYLEDLWSGCGILLVLVLPVAALALTLCLLALVWLVRRYLEHREDRQRLPCPACGHAVLPTALRCKQCHTSLAPPTWLSWKLWYGTTPAAGPADEAQRKTQALRLLSLRRCPACAEKVELTEVLAGGCPLCGAEPLRHGYPLWSEDYHRATLRRGWLLLLPVVAASFLPVIGYAVAVVATRVLVVAPLRAMLGRGRRFLLRWGLRLLTLLLLIPANLPVVSIFAAPVILVAHLLAYGHAARGAARQLDLKQVRRP